MARLNYVSVRGLVTNIDCAQEAGNTTYVVQLTVAMSDRDSFASRTGYRLHNASVPVKSGEKNICDVFSKMSVGDIVNVTGYIATRVGISTKKECPSCHTLSTAQEAGVVNGRETKTLTYILPIGVTLVKSAKRTKAKIIEKEGQKVEQEVEEELPDALPGYIEHKKEKGEEVKEEDIPKIKEQLKNKMMNEKFARKVEEVHYIYLKNHSEDGNRVLALGNVVSDPITGEADEGRTKYTRFQIAMNRKYHSTSPDETANITDYPWVYSYGNGASDDAKYIRKGSLVLVDGALQSRKYKDTYICPECGEAFPVRGRTLEILSYGTEYLEGCGKMEEKGEEEEEEKE